MRLANSPRPVSCHVAYATGRPRWPLTGRHSWSRRCHRGRWNDQPRGPIGPAATVRGVGQHAKLPPPQVGLGTESPGALLSPHLEAVGGRATGRKSHVLIWDTDQGSSMTFQRSARIRPRNQRGSAQSESRAAPARHEELARQQGRTAERYVAGGCLERAYAGLLPRYLRAAELGLRLWRRPRATSRPLPRSDATRPAQVLLSELGVPHASIEPTGRFVRVRERPASGAGEPRERFAAGQPQPTPDLPATR